MPAGAKHRVLAMVVAAMLAAPSVAAAEPAGVAVDASGLEAVGEEISTGVTAELNPLLEREGIDATQLRVRVGWLDADEINYAIYASFDRTLPEDQLPLVETCRGCSIGAVVKKTVAVVETKLIPEEKKRLAEAEPPPPVVAPDAATPPPDDAAPAGPQRLGAMGKSGIGLLASGVAVAITGAALLGVGKTRPEADMSQIRDFRPTGYVLLGTGGAMLIVGSVLLGIDRGRAKRGKQTARLDPLVFGGRF